MRDGQELLPMTVQHGLYVVQCELLPAVHAAMTASATASNQDERALWHARLGHASAGIMHKLATRHLMPATAHGPRTTAR
jgi:hypothetical protein